MISIYSMEYWFVKMGNNKNEASWLMINFDERQHIDSFNRIIFSDSFTLIVVITPVTSYIDIFLHASL